MKTKWLGLIMLSVFLLLACKKDTLETESEPPAYKFYPVNSDLKSYGFFKVGSYWIYRIDSASFLTDSVYVTSVTTSTYSTWKNEDSIVVWEKIVVYYGFSPNYSDRFYSSLTLSSYPNQCIYTPDAFTIFELDSTNISPTLGGGMIENTSVSNYVLNGLNFGNCRLLKYAYKYYKPSMPELWYYSDCYWKKNVGLVKNAHTKLYNICNLLRYSVIQ